MHIMRAWNCALGGASGCRACSRWQGEWGDALVGRFFTTESPGKLLLLSHFSRVRLCATP